LTAEIAQLKLPAGTCVFTVSASDRHDQPGKLWVTVHLTVPVSTGPDALRPIATDIAHMLKKTEIGQRTSVVDVTDLGSTKPQYEYKTLLSDEDFQAHPWDGTPSREAEMTIWKYVAPSK
jgi:hypothetical protein